MAPSTHRVPSPPRHPVRRGLFALILIAVGVWLMATAGHEPTETVAARVSATELSFTHAEDVLFKFADGSKDDVVSPTAAGFYDAVARFGPGSARVTRNAKNDSIYRVEFHGKTYTLGSPGNDFNGGIVALVLGLLLLAYVAITSLLYLRSTS